MSNEKEVAIGVHVPTLCHIAEVTAANLEELTNEMAIVEGTPQWNSVEYVGKRGIATGYTNVLNYINGILADIKAQKEAQENEVSE